MIKEILKKNEIVVSIYENIGMLKSVFAAKKNYVCAKKSLSTGEIRRIKQYKDIHKGERCFIVGTGPSQNINDLERLQNEITFTVNTGYKAYSKTKWRADYYVVMDENAVPFFEEAINAEHMYKGIFCTTWMKNVKGGEKAIRLAIDGSTVFLFDTIWNQLFPTIFPLAKFSKDISKKVYAGKTVVYACIQIAAYMGFSEIYLTGVDCSYNIDKAHFDLMSYQLDAAGQKRVVRSGMLMKRQMEALADILPKYNVKVYNATRGGALEAFQRVKLEDIL